MARPSRRPRSLTAGRAFLLALAIAASAAAQTPTPAQSVDRAGLAARVREEFLRSWRGYREYAWGHDELKPVSRAPKDWNTSTLLMTAVDALDTMLLMGLSREAEETKAYILANLKFDRDMSVQNFEITIRILGGLLSSYEMTGDAGLLRLAEDLGNRLLPVFDSPTGMPYRYVNLRTGKTSGALSNPAEIGTLILEFGTLSRLTKRDVFRDEALNALTALYHRRNETGLVGDQIDVETGQWKSLSSHIGGGIDSYYEYLAKCDHLFHESRCGVMWRESVAAVNRYLADERPDGLWYGEADMKTGRRTATTYGALQAFFPAVLAFTGDLERARRLQDSGRRMWSSNGVEPDTFDYAAMRVVDPGYPLRPEIIESAYYLYHYTGESQYLEMGRDFFEDLQRYCRTDVGYTVLESVVTKKKGDLMPSFFLAETLKYLYLLFAPEALDFDRVVFNTEGHPLKLEP
ncbi:MAG TPA: glycoside hydrolase family 47 protein [Thermoanaerobaculia bacterium]|nr:glycoside hydrolase family 47 protein [Thermoanaerobaculia bacterium]